MGLHNSSPGLFAALCSGWEQLELFWDGTELACWEGLGIPLLSLLSVLSCSLQSEALQQLRKDSESIRSRYAHYFDLSIVNNGVEESLKLLEEAFEQACSSPQWVPISWVY